MLPTIFISRNISFAKHAIIYKCWKKGLGGHLNILILAHFELPCWTSLIQWHFSPFVVIFLCTFLYLDDISHLFNYLPLIKPFWSGHKFIITFKIRPNMWFVRKSKSAHFGSFLTSAPPTIRTSKIKKINN